MVNVSSKDYLMKIHTSSTPIATHAVRSNVSGKKRVVDALILETPDLSFYVRLQNLINFLLDQINNQISLENSFEQGKKIEICLNHIETILKNDSSSIGKEMLQILEDLLEEGHHYKNILQTFSSSPSSNSSPFEILIAGKSTQIQWLGVCLIEEIKKHFQKPR
jgi:hypothetical protein